MKFYLFSLTTAVFLLFGFWACDSLDEEAIKANNSLAQEIYPVLHPDGFLIYPNGAVHSPDGELLGYYENGSIFSVDGILLIENIDKKHLNAYNPAGFIIDENLQVFQNGEMVGKMDAEGNIILNNGAIYSVYGEMLQPPTTIDPNFPVDPNLPIIHSSSSIVPPVVHSSSSTTPPVVHSSSSTTPPVVRSSSSTTPPVVRSSSSATPPNNGDGNNTGSCPTLNPTGSSQQGWASRYWDCCKPHCAWTGNTSNPCKTCDQNHNEIGLDGQSGCEGGNSFVCLSHAPYAVCDKISYGFAAVPADLGGQCGKCFLLTFDGTGQHGTNANHRAIKGKQMVVMVSNIGGDVQSGQFDIMIPGGGVGLFDGCSRQWGVSNDKMGAQYGGLLTDCENSLGYNASKEQYKSCLEQKCRSLFSDSKLKQGLDGCLWHANWLEAANNPKFTYQEVACPAELVSKYASTKK